MNPMIELWFPTDREFAIYGGGKKVYSSIVPASEVICDICNADVAIRPVPLIYGSYAVCLDCLAREYPDWRERVPVDVIAEWERQNSK